MVSSGKLDFDIACRVIIIKSHVGLSEHWCFIDHQNEIQNILFSYAINFGTDLMERTTKLNGWRSCGDCTYDKGCNIFRETFAMYWVFRYSVSRELD